MFLTTIDCEVLVVVTAWFAKVSEPGVSETAGPPVPVPVKLTDWVAALLGCLLR